MQDIDRVQSMGEPPRRPPDPRAPRRPVKRAADEPESSTADTDHDPDPERAGTIDLRV